MLSLSRKTDYALSLLTALAGSDGFLSLKEVSKQHGLPYRFLSQVVRPLVTNGILESREGIHGGYRLARKPSDVTIREVVVAEEGGVAIAACLDPARDYACSLKYTCTAAHRMPRLQQMILRALGTQTLADLLPQVQKKERNNV